MLRIGCLMAGVASLAVAWSAHGETNWPRFGGPQGVFLSAESGLPVAWSADAVQWKTPLEGTGPIVAHHLGRPDLSDHLARRRPATGRVLPRPQRRQHALAAHAWTGEPEPIATR